MTKLKEVRPRKDKRGVDLISEVLPFGPFRNASRIRRLLKQIALRNSCKSDRNDLAELSARLSGVV